MLFDIHGIHVRLVSDSHKIGNSVSRELIGFAAQKKVIPSITIYVCRHTDGKSITPEVVQNAEQISPGIFTFTDFQEMKSTILLKRGYSFDEAVLVTLSIVGYISRFLLAKKKQLTGIHSASLAYGSKGVLLAGNSGSGKTTMSLLLIKKGFKYLSDEETFIEKKRDKLTLLSFPRHIRIGDGFAESSEGKDMITGHTLTRYSAFYQDGFIINPDDISSGCRLKSAKLAACIVLAESEKYKRLTVKKSSGTAYLYKLLSLAETLSTNTETDSVQKIIRKNNRKAYDIINFMFDTTPVFHIQYSLKKNSAELADFIKEILDYCK
ncbi:MAG: hypothetical protein HZA77_14385 [Candidatus Schekmanbacteria bacterium]|nr:hypothetical protein [Candidatus Schekmanbacteria bacterium]